MKTVKPQFKVINSLDATTKLKRGVTYSTTNYDMFEKLQFNRGLDNGIEPVRLKEFQQMLDKDDYLLGEIHGKINIFGKLLDGTHRLELHRINNIPYNFQLSGETRYDVINETELAEVVSLINNKNSKWNQKAHFLNALKNEKPLALVINELKAKTDNKYGLKKGILSEGRIHALISRDKRGLNSTLKTVKDFNNDDLVKVLKDKDFKNEFAFACRIVSDVQNWIKNVGLYANLNPFTIVRNIMPLVWDNKVNMEEFYTKLTKRGFHNIGNSTKGIKNLINELNKERTPRNLISFK